ncbi:MAG: 2-oxo acid dehydrogenase subunit E2, partial [Candidatus Diapherotrites archaeon]|nr:2-oxo acid dehydrogenase subunit E2 [Candidatus Diapherotrites archaeon]
SIPDAVQFDEADVTELVRHREKEKANAEKLGVKLTYLPFVMKAVVKALKKFPKFNSSLDEEKQEIVLKGYYHLGIATDTPEGLMVPVVRDVDKKSILQIAKELHELTEKARERKIALQDLKGQTFTVTSVGNLGGTHFVPIINRPDVAIIGVPKFEKKVRVMENDQIAIRSVGTLSLAFDHRIIDGADAARFLSEVIKYLEDPDLLLIE